MTRDSDEATELIQTTVRCINCGFMELKRFRGADVDEATNAYRIDCKLTRSNKSTENFHDSVPICHKGHEVDPADKRSKVKTRSWTPLLEPSRRLPSL